jgi:hypothetical protein
MRQRTTISSALAARAYAAGVEVVIEPRIYEKIEQIQIIDAEKLFREENRDIRHNTVRMRHFHDNQNKVKRFRK